MTWPKPRDEVLAMDPYKAPLEGRRNFLRLDFNENTIGPSPKVIEALNKVPQNHIAVYPEYAGIKEALIENLQYKGIHINQFQIGLFNGVDAAIHAIFHAYGSKDDYLLTTEPTFGYYSPCADMQGMKILAVPYQGKNFEFPLQEVKITLSEKKPKLFFICNPNNPTGTKLAAQVILDLAHESPETLFVVDELYEAFGGDSLLPISNFNSTKNILVLQSLSKTAGLAGLRIGFAIGNNNVINFITRVTGPYDINSYASTAAIAALSDQQYIDSYVNEVLLAKNWLQNKLIKYNIKHHNSGGNYLLIWPKCSSEEIENNLRGEGILIRNMSKKPLLDNSFRVSIGTREQMQRFWKALIKNKNIN